VGALCLDLSYVGFFLTPEIHSLKPFTTENTESTVEEKRKATTDHTDKIGAEKSVCCLLCRGIQGLGGCHLGRYWKQLVFDS
jgi:hypothetical protein